jgi:DNA-binding NtrC family response regulator
MVQDIRSGERLARSESVTGVLTLVVEPPAEGGGRAGILVRETPRLAARAVIFLEELVQLAGVAFAGLGAELEAVEPAVRPAQEAAVGPAAQPVEASPAEIVLRSTDDLKKIVETVEREVIDRAMRRVEGNQSRGAQVLNISRGSLIAKLKEFGVPDYRYMRRARGRRD